jgi:hypothetical protein
MTAKNSRSNREMPLFFEFAEPFFLKRTRTAIQMISINKEAPFSSAMVHGMFFVEIKNA